MAGTVSKTVQLPNGDKMPTVGFGTWTIWRHEESKVYESVKTALTLGYRHVDCAWVYRNEEEVGRALKEKIADGTVTRKDVFLTSKVWDTQHRRAKVKETLERSLKLLGTDYVDLYLIHWPTSFKEGEIDFPRDENNKIIYDNVDIMETWQGMEDCVDAGLARSIGVSNFNSKQIQRVLDNGRIKPVNLQVEIHPLLSNKQLVDFCFQRKLTVTAYAPLCAPNRTWAKPDEPKLLEEPVVKEIAAAKGKTPGQVCLRFLLQRGLVVIPQSSNPERIKQNLEVYDFELSEEEMQKMWSLDRGLRVYLQDISADHPEYPLNEPF